jgi:hypothetical protein
VSGYRFLNCQDLHFPKAHGSRDQGGRAATGSNFFAEPTIDEMARQMVGQDRRMFAQYGCMLNHIRQFAHVAGPRVLHQGRNGFFGEEGLNL